MRVADTRREPTDRTEDVGRPLTDRGRVGDFSTRPNRETQERRADPPAPTTPRGAREVRGPRGRDAEHDALRRVHVRAASRTAWALSLPSRSSRGSPPSASRWKLTDPLASRPSLASPRRSTAPSESSYGVPHDEEFIDAFATLRARDNLATYDSRFETYHAIEADVRREGRVVPLAKTRPRPRPARKVVLVLGEPEGSNKARHCARLARDYGFVFVSAAALTREEVKAEMDGVAPFERWDGLVASGAWEYATELTLRLLRREMTRAGNQAMFLVDWFPRNLDQVREFHEKICAVDFVLFLDVEPPPERGVAGGPEDPEDEPRKRFEAFARKHAVVLNHYKSEGMVHHVRSPGDAAYVRVVPNRAAVVGPMPRGFWRGERLARDAWTAKERSDWTWSEPGRVTVQMHYEEESVYADVRTVMRREGVEPLDPDPEDMTSPEKAMVRKMQASARNYLARKEFESTVGERVDRLVTMELE